ncbi:Hok/Gef family protein [Providencia manganoxydans]
MTKYAFMALLAVCITVLCLSSMLRDKLCSLHITSGHTVVQATLDYELR